MSFTLPRSSIDWERALCQHFLLLHDGDVSPIRSFEITKSTLAETCDGDPVDDAEAAFEAFRSAFNSKAAVDALEKGVYRSLEAEGLPGCFGYLALTVLLDGLLDEEILEDRARDVGDPV